MTSNDWKPDLYLRFKKERTQASIDLTARIKLESPKNIIDIGCGPGNSTQILAHRWPEAKILGIDSSPAMIQKAKEEFPLQDWAEMDAANLHLPNKFDLVFSNAAIQWLPDHDKLLADFWKVINTNGALAVQIPLYHLMPISSIVEETAKSDKWNDAFKTLVTKLTINEAGYYYDVLSRFTDNISIWESRYQHVMNSHSEIFEMLRSTGIKPYLERLSNDREKEEFAAIVIEKMAGFYPVQKDNKVLLPFNRLFFIAYKNK